MGPRRRRLLQHLPHPGRGCVGGRDCAQRFLLVNKQKSRDATKKHPLNPLHTGPVQPFYAMFEDVHVMMFIGKARPFHANFELQRAFSLPSNPLDGGPPKALPTS